MINELFIVMPINSQMSLQTNLITMLNEIVYAAFRYLQPMALKFAYFTSQTAMTLPLESHSRLSSTQLYL